MRTLAILSCLVLASATVAATLSPTSITATSVDTLRGVTVYSNVTTQTGYYFNSQPYTTPQELGDDLYMTGGGVLEGFKFTYASVDPAPAPVAAVIAFYDLATFNYGGGNVPIAAYSVGPLPGNGAWIITVSVDPMTAPLLPANIMMTQLMDTVDSGPLTFYPPTVGSTTDGVWAGAPDNMFFTSGMFGLPPNTLNFGYEVTVPEPAALLLVGLAGLLIRRR